MKENRKAKLDEVMKELKALQRKGMWSRSLLERVLSQYKDADASGKKKEYAGIVIWYLEQRLQRY